MPVQKEAFGRKLAERQQEWSSDRMAHHGRDAPALRAAGIFFAGPPLLVVRQVLRQWSVGPTGICSRCAEDFNNVTIVSQMGS